jgi:crotonobetainyl-CoA:carnitine CoA-transferase CaiB-like acyl-CoA transferase
MNVIRIEHPERPDPNRFVGRDVLGEKGMNTYYFPNNVDIFATNQLPRNYPKLGVDYERLKSIKENIIWMGVTGVRPLLARFSVEN